jgi:glycosyltransferase involved in cell wall biosynthesis
MLTRRKNLRFLLEAFLRAKREAVLSKDTRLVLVGQDAWDTHEIEHLFSKEAGIIRLGYVSDEMLPALFRFCKALIFPSIYEGYGIPLIEAMSQNAPIIISDIQASMELNQRHNKQMLVFELGDEEALIELLEHVERNAELLRERLDYGDLSPYYYENVAKEHLSVYTRVLEHVS